MLEKLWFWILLEYITINATIGNRYIKLYIPRKLQCDSWVLINFKLLKRILLNRAPSSILLHPSPPSSFQPPPSSLQHPQQYSNQNIARNLAISPNLGRKIQSPFWPKSSAHAILEVLIPNPNLDFLNSNPKIHFLGKFGPKNSKLSVLSKKWHTWYLKNADSFFNISFLNFQPKNPFWAKLVHGLVIPLSKQIRFHKNKVSSNSFYVNFKSQSNFRMTQS